MNRNRQVSYKDYASCVQEQVDFLKREGLAVRGDEVPYAEVRICYDNGVSVDTCASWVL